LEAGKQILIEIGRRGLRGYYFNKQQYHELKAIADFQDAKTKIAEYGYPSVVKAKDPKEIVTLLKNAENKKERSGCLLYAVCEMLFWFILSLLTCAG